MTVDVEALDGSTAECKAAINFRANCLVEAVPGFVKTRVIVARSEAHLAEGVVAQEILLLTTLRRASGELRARLARRLKSATTPESGSLHGSVALTLAGEWAYRAVFLGPSERAAFERAFSMISLPLLQGGADTIGLRGRCPRVLVEKVQGSDPMRAELLQRLGALLFVRRLGRTISPALI